LNELGHNRFSDRYKTTECVAKIPERNLNSVIIKVDTRNSKIIVQFENGGIYEGTWNEERKRYGYGIQTWVDCSKYEGYWDIDKANGYGKLYHADGDIYEGEWKNDKAHGYGTYIHENGNRFEGNWHED